MRNYNSAFNHVINYISIVPYLYRYEDENWVDDFFTNGKLKLSSFNNYKGYKDNQLGDRHEGSSMNFATSESNLTLGTFTTVGINDYCFCTSTLLDEKLLDIFSRNSVFRIKDPMNFILEITRSLPRVIQVLHGCCIYVDNRILKKDIGRLDMSDFQNEEGKVVFEKMAQLSDVQGPDGYFLKHKIFQQHSEYRMLWQTNRPVKDFIIIDCPEAVKFCEKVDVSAILDCR